MLCRTEQIALSSRGITLALWCRPRTPSVCVQALEECVLSMRRGEITLLLAHSRYAYGPLGR